MPRTGNSAGFHIGFKNFPHLKMQFCVCVGLTYLGKTFQILTLHVKKLNLSVLFSSWADQRRITLLSWGTSEHIAKTVCDCFLVMHVWGVNIPM